MKQPTLPAVAMAALSLGATLGLAAPQQTPPPALNATTTPAPGRTQPAAVAAPTGAARKPLGRPGGGDVMSIMGDTPVMPHDPNTHPECTWWYDNDGALTCFDILSIFGISAGDFAYWNPSVSSSCGGMEVGFSYCVEGPAGPPGGGNPTSTTTTSSEPTTTKPPGNGIETPRPVQDGMVGNCNKFYFVPSGESCSDVLRKNSLTISQLFAWNSAVKADCTGMWAEVYVCVGVIGGSPVTTPKPTTTKPPGNGISTPTPVQDGMVGNCNKFYFVPSGESCSDVLRKNSLTISQLFAWNSAVKSDCTGMWAEVYVCVGVIGGGSPVTTPRPTTTKSGNGITTPTPTQPGMVGNCNKFYFVAEGKSCSNVLSENGITIAQLFAWNSGVKSDCSGMWANVYVCVAVVGQQPPRPTTTTTKPPGNGIATPTPTQPGMVGNCDKFYLVPSGESCSTVLSKHGITLAQFFAWNSGVKSDCSGMWANVYACVSVLGHEPPTTTRGNGVTTPTPTQAGMVSNCKRFHKVATGQNCDTIAKQYGITVANFVRWNPAAKSDCTGLWANTYACVGLL